MTGIVDGKVMGVNDRVVDVQEKVQDVRGDVQGVHSVVQDVHCDVQGVGNEIQGVDDKVQGIGSDLKEISSELRGVEGKLDQVNSSSSLCHLLITLALTALQGTSSEIVFSDGFLSPIRQSIITLHPKFIITVQFNGFFKAVYSINGNQPNPFCGYTENVRYSSPSICNGP